MIAVIFEVWPADGRKQTYLDIAASLKPELERIDGFSLVGRGSLLQAEDHPRADDGMIGGSRNNSVEAKGCIA